MLESITEGLWHDQFDLIAPLGVHFRGRMVVARLPDGTLWVHSPIPIDDALAEQLAELGPVAHLVSPNAFHHVHFEAAATRYGDAQRWITPALARKRPQLEHDQLLGDEAPPAWADCLDQLPIGGMPKVDEVTFFHRASGTVILTDLVFNILEYRGWMSGLVFRMAGTHKRFAQSRLLRSMVRDREAAGRAARRLLAWDVRRVVMAHGEIIEQDARERLTEALGWMLEGAPVAEAS